MLNYAQRFWLVKNVDRYALSDMRIEALKSWPFNAPTEDEIKEIGDFICIGYNSARLSIEIGE